MQHHNPDLTPVPFQLHAMRNWFGFVLLIEERNDNGIGTILDFDQHMIEKTVVIGQHDETVPLAILMLKKVQNDTRLRFQKHVDAKQKFLYKTEI